MNDQLTPRQRAILYFIEGFIADYNYPPTLAEIAYGTNANSTEAIRYQVLQLQARGMLRLEKGMGMARTIVLTERVVK